MALKSRFAFISRFQEQSAQEIDAMSFPSHLKPARCGAMCVFRK